MSTTPTESMALAVANWARGRDTGLSSIALARVATGGTCTDWEHPADGGDLGRCIRLLERAPAVRDHFSKVRKVGPMWAAVIDHWDELTSIYASELPTNRFPKTYARMNELFKEARKATP